MLARHGEPLSDHLLRTAHVAKQLSGKLKINLDREAYLAGLLHDVGKADSGAQRRIMGNAGCPGHEVVSAVVAFEVLQGLQVEQRFEVVLAVLRHHQAMRSAKEALDKVKKWFEGRIDHREELEAALREGLGVLGYGDPSFTWPVSCEKLEERIIEMQRVFEKFYSCSEYVLQARLLSGLIMVADTYVAGTVAAEPEEKESLYKREVKRFVESLLGLSKTSW